MKGTHLGEFEELVMLAVHSLGDDAYGVPVQQMLEEETGRTISIGAVYSALDRLEQKAHLVSNEGPSTSKRGGRRTRRFLLTPAGLAALDQSRRVRERLWSRLDGRRGPSRGNA